MFKCSFGDSEERGGDAWRERDREARFRAPVFLCMIACFAEWHMRRRLAMFPAEKGSHRNGVAVATGAGSQVKSRVICNICIWQ